MIIELQDKDLNEIIGFIEEDNARNYFIRLGLENKKSPFSKIYGQIMDNGLYAAMLFLRNSGNLQFYAKEEFDVVGFSKVIRSLDYKSLISPASYCDLFQEYINFSKTKEGAYIAVKEIKQDNIINNIENENNYIIDSLKLTDLDEIVDLYKSVFPSFASKEIMNEKIRSKRGRGVCIRENGKIISVAQSEFENHDYALIVGVATQLNHRKKGLASICLKTLCNELILEGKTLFLQYDNIEAGRIYEKIGFEFYDRVKFYYK